MTRSQAARWVALPIGVCAISTSGILIRLTEAPPLVTATHRLLWAAAILLTFAFFRNRHDLALLRGRTLGLLAASGALVGAHFALWTSALFHTSVASAVLLTDTHPVLIAIGSRAFLGEATPLGVWAGIALTLLGSVIIAGGDILVGGSALLGDAMALGASVTFAGYLVIGRRARQELGVVTYAGVVYGIGGVLSASAPWPLGCPCCRSRSVTRSCGWPWCYHQRWLVTRFSTGRCAMSPPPWSASPSSVSRWSRQCSPGFFWANRRAGRLSLAALPSWLAFTSPFAEVRSPVEANLPSLALQRPATSADRVLAKGPRRPSSPASASAARVRDSARSMLLLHPIRMVG